MLRAPRGRLPDDIEFVSVEMTVDASGAAGRFVLFLREAVRRAPDGRLSGNKMWEAWAERNGESSSLPLIAGIDRRDIHRHFRIAFDEDKMSWKRLDGEPQWLWMGYGTGIEGRRLAVYNSIHALCGVPMGEVVACTASYTGIARACTALYTLLFPSCAVSYILLFAVRRRADLGSSLNAL